MPTYKYYCNKCDQNFEYFHTISEKYEICEKCNEKSLFKVPSFCGNIVKEKSPQVGSLVESAIKEAKESIEQEKKKLKNTDYKVK